jgi:hypothetical protein
MFKATSLLRRIPNLGFGVLAVMASLVVLTLTQLNNGLLTQIRTGTEIVHTGQVLHHDPYSFSAVHHAWIDQSWLIEALYGVANSLAGVRGVVDVNLAAGFLTLAVMTWLGWQKGLLRVSVALVPALILLCMSWSLRPVAFAVLWFALELLIVSRFFSPIWFLPLGWLWVNSHGSYIIGLLWLVGFVIGSRLDHKPDLLGRTKYLLFMLLGDLFGALSPAGWKIVLFWTIPFGHRAHVFRSSGDWRPIDLTQAHGLAIALICVAVVVFAVKYRWHWRYGIGFLLIGLCTLGAMRNVVFLAVALIPLSREAAMALSPSPKSTSVTKPLVGVLAAFSCVFAAAAVASRATDSVTNETRNYPVAPVKWMAAHQLLNANSRVGGREEVGNVIEWLYGPKVKAFYDDRFDMYPPQVSDDASDLTTGRNVAAITDKYRLTSVVVQSNTSLDGQLAADITWQRVYDLNGWSVYKKT